MALFGSVLTPWTATIGAAICLAFLIIVTLMRRAQLRDYGRSHREILRAREHGSHTARLQHPDIDLAQCIGCGACVRACPEEGVLALLHGQAAVIHGARCVGHARCAAVCPTGAISLTFGDLSRRRDLPVLTPELEAIGVPGLFTSGELGGFALVRTAVAQGVAVADAVVQRVTAAGTAPARSPANGAADVLDLLIVGAGPSGLACSLRAKERGLRFLTLEQEAHIGGTVAAYPRKKMVMTQPVDLPLHGRLTQLSYQKEELVELWNQVAASNQLPIRLGVKLQKIVRQADGLFVADTSAGEITARHVCLALGRRGSPRKLGVPGEDLSKVSYSLLDAESYQNRHILIVGGGDSAVEAALGLSEQPGNQVTMSYRKEAFFRLKAKNDARITRALHESRVKVLFGSEVISIDAQNVRVRVDSRQEVLANDEVFIFAGGDPPFALLEQAGVSFDPADRPAQAVVVERDTALFRAMVLTGLCTIGLIAWATWFRDYYALNANVRANSPWHRLLRPTGPIGVVAGIAACFLFTWNLAYLLRRSFRLGRLLPGSLRLWMGWHVFTGLLAVLFVLLHAGFMVRSTSGGHALLALALVVFSGSVGRYLYAFIPRAANGTEATLEDLRTRLAKLSGEWDREGRGFGERVREQIDHLISTGRWHPSLLARIGALIAGQWRLRRSLRALRRAGRQEGIPVQEVRHVLLLARRAYRLTLLVTHYDEVVAVLSSWRYFHRWLGLLMVMLAIVHIVTAVRYASFDFHFTPILSGGMR